MKTTLSLLLILVAAAALADGPVIQTTPFTRNVLRAPDAGTARSDLGIIATNAWPLTNQTLVTPTVNSGTFNGGTFTGPTNISGLYTNPVVSGGTFTGPTNISGLYTNPVVSGGTFTGPTNIGGLYTNPIVSGGMFNGPTNIGGLYTNPVVSGGMFNRPTNNNAVSTSGTFNGVFSNNSTFQGGTYSGNAAGLTNLFGNDVVMSFSIYTNQNWGKSNWFSPGGSAFGVPTNGNGPANTIITNGTLAVAPGIPLTNYQGQLTSNKIYFIVTCSNAAPYQAIGMNFVADTLAGTNLPQEDIFLISSPAQLVQSNCEFCIPPADFIHSYLSYGVSSSLTIEFATNFPVDEFIVNVPVDRCFWRAWATAPGTVS